MAWLDSMLKPLSLNKLAMLAMVFVLTAIGLVTSATYYLLLKAEANAQRDKTALIADLISARTRELLLVYGQSMTTVALSPETIGLLTAERLGQRTRKAQELKKSLPDVLDAVILPAREFTDPTVTRCLVSHQHGGTLIGAQRFHFHRTERFGQHIDLTEPIVASPGGPVIGLVLLRIDGRVMQSVVNRALPTGGLIRLRQIGESGDETIVAAAGTAQENGMLVTRAPVAHTPWVAELSHHQRWPTFTAGQVFVYSGLIFGALAVALGGTAYVHYRTRRAMDSDIRSIARIFQDTRDGKVRVDYPIEFTDFKKIFSYLRHSGKKLVIQQHKLRSMGLIDHLSQQHNRRAFERRLEELFERAKSTGPSSVLIIDLDHFKQVNDRYGHDVGDNLIVGFSESVKRLIRNTDFLARLGGDEFAIIFPHTELQLAIGRVAQLRRELPEAIILTPAYQHPLRWTGGLAVMQDDDDKPEDVVKRADQALFKAKEAGRNRTCYFDPAYDMRAI